MAGSTVRASAAGSSDPDGNDLTYGWNVYPEAGTYPGTIDLANVSSPSVELHVPADAFGKTIHLLLTVRDRGQPPLARYRRIVVRVAEK